jgi:hypothetical protein
MKLALHSLQMQQHLAQQGGIFPNNNFNPYSAAAFSALMAPAPALPGDDPRMVASQEMFPAVDLTIANAIFTNKFDTENLLRLDVSFLHRQSQLFWSFNPAGYIGLSIAPPRRTSSLKNMRQLRNSCALWKSIRRLSFNSHLSLESFRCLLPTLFTAINRMNSTRRIRGSQSSSSTWLSTASQFSTGPYIPEGWSRQDHGLETIYLHKP